MRYIKFVILLNLFAVAGLAQVPGTISYQGFLTDNTGDPLTGNYNLTFNFYDGSTVLATRTVNGVEVFNGVFSVIIGKDVSGDNTPLPFTIWDKPLTVGITIGAEAELPKVTLTGVPYAFIAQTANTVVDGSITNTKLSNAAVTNDKLASGVDASKLTTGTLPIARIADGAVTSAKITDGTLATADLADGAVTSIKIFDGTITAADIADGNVTNVKVASGLDAAKLTVGTLPIDRIADGTITSAKIADGSIVNADINSSASIADTKLATISTAGKVSGSAITSGTIGGSTAINTTGSVAAASFSGNGSSITGLNAGNISSGTLANARLATNVDVNGNLTTGGGLHVGSSGAPTTDNLEVDGYTKLGISAPAVRMSKLTGTTSGSASGTVGINHGLTVTKILSVSVLVEYTTGNFVHDGFIFNAGYNFNWYLTATQIVVANVDNTEGSSINIRAKNIVVLITYEE